MSNVKTGAYVPEFKVGTLFQKTLLALSVLALITIAGVKVYTLPNTFTVDDKHWACRESEPVGISAECTLLAKKKSLLRTE